MIVADTSALITVASIDLLDTLVSDFDIHTTETVLEELKATSEYEDRHAKAAQTVLAQTHRINIHNTENTDLQSSRIDEGEATTIELTNQLESDFLITDDLRALPELQPVVEARVAISPIILKAFVKRDVLDEKEALEKLEEAAKNRDWLESPIYRRARNLFK
ncbi:hypothetical protein [Natrinema sp. H-ect4]|uniref:hypothetical protein n=1 Tax=Natrinema sp. H-ect4 TaxID=3242699 RepID=UPI0035A91D99